MITGLLLASGGLATVGALLRLMCRPPHEDPLLCGVGSALLLTAAFVLAIAAGLALA